jgi:hypothetical protein
MNRGCEVDADHHEQRDGQDVDTSKVLEHGGDYKTKRAATWVALISSSFTRRGLRRRLHPRHCHHLAAQTGHPALRAAAVLRVQLLAQRMEGLLDFLGQLLDASSVIALGCLLEIVDLALDVRALSRRDLIAQFRQSLFRLVGSTGRRCCALRSARGASYLRSRAGGLPAPCARSLPCSGWSRL